MGPHCTVSGSTCGSVQCGGENVLTMFTHLGMHGSRGHLPSRVLYCRPVGAFSVGSGICKSASAYRRGKSRFVSSKPTSTFTSPWGKLCCSQRAGGEETSYWASASPLAFALSSFLYPKRHGRTHPFSPTLRGLSRGSFSKSPITWVTLRRDVERWGHRTSAYVLPLMLLLHEVHSGNYYYC